MCAFSDVDSRYAQSASSQNLIRTSSANSADVYLTNRDPASISFPNNGIDRGDSTGSYVSKADSDRFPNPHHNLGPPRGLDRNPSEMLRNLASYAPKGPLELHDEVEDGYWEEEEEEDENRFVNLSLLSHLAVQLRDKVPRGTHVKGSVPYPRAFTGKDIVSGIQTQIQRELAINHGISTNDRRAALQVARSLQSQLFFYEVEWGGRVLQDGVEDVYMFMDDEEGPDVKPEREELPTGVVTMLTACYSPSCGDGVACYSYSCPRRVRYSSCSHFITSIVLVTGKLYGRTIASADRSSSGA